MKQIAEQFIDAPIGAVAHQEQSQDEAAQPQRGHRQPAQDAAVGGEAVRSKGGREGLRGLVGLLVDERAADLLVLRQAGDRAGPGQGRDRQRLALVGRQEVSGTGRGGGSRDDGARGAG